MKSNIIFRINQLLHLMLEISGPNGAGKSTIVNGIALALGAKTAVLGRADHIVSFARIFNMSFHSDFYVFQTLSVG